MKKYLYISLAIIAAVAIFGRSYAATILFPSQGGTGIGSITAGDIGKVLTVTGNNPFTYSLSTASGGGVGTSTEPFMASWFVATSTTATSTFAGGLSIAGASGLSVLQNGNVGVGTAAPQADLHISGASGSTFYISKTNTNAIGRLQMTNAGEFQIFNQETGSGGHLTFGTNSLERMRIDKNGNIGIGTTSPWAKLSVEGISTLGNQAIAGYFTATSTTATSTLAGGLNVAGASGLTVLQNGNVGVGTAAPANKLDVSSSVLGEGAILGNAYVGVWTSNNTYAMFSHNAVSNKTTGYGFIQNSSGNTWFNGVSEINFNISAGNYMKLTNSTFYTIGVNVGIGTTSPYAKLSVTNTGTAPSFLVEDSTSPDQTPFIVTANGSVGVGTSSPMSKFAVNGDISGSNYSFDTAYDADHRCRQRFDNSLFPSWYFECFAGGTWKQLMWVTDGTGSGDGYMKFTDNTNSKSFVMQGNGFLNGSDNSEVLTYDPGGDSVAINGTVSIDGSGNLNTGFGKVTAGGGFDPAYVMYNAHTRQELVDRITFEVPPDMYENAVVFFNKDTKKMESYIPSEGNFYDLMGTRLNTIPMLPKPVQTKTVYSFDHYKGEIVGKQEIVQPVFKISPNYYLNKTDGKVYLKTKVEKTDEKTGKKTTVNEDLVATTTDWLIRK